MRLSKYAMLIVALSLATAIAADSKVPVAYEALAGVDQLWQWPGNVRTAMSSSTDTTGGNNDMRYFHGEYRGEKILAKITGPGAIYRIWAAWPSGTIKFYIDGADKPEIRCDFKKYLEGKCEGLPADFAVGRWANYMPIPFEKSILVTTTGFHIPAYFQVSYQTYDKSVKVQSLRKAEIASSPYFKEAVARWKNSGSALVVGDKTASFSDVVKSNAETNVVELSSPGMISELAIFNPDNPSDSLEGMTLKIKWDGDDEYAVNAPMDAFFVNKFGHAANWPGGSLKNEFIAVDAKGYRAFFPMPFEKAVVVIENKGADKKVSISVKYTDQAPPSGAMRFHASYAMKDTETNATEQTTFTMAHPLDPATNYVVLDRKGRGHYIGCALFVKSVSNLWWGEGDEMTYIDGEREPSIRGTGTEDEFNWSWGYNPHMSPVSGTLPVYPSCKESLAAQVVPAFRNKECLKVSGDNISYRFRPSDYVPFNSSIKVTYEILEHSWVTPNSVIAGNLTQDRGDDFSSVAYWYEAR